MRPLFSLMVPVWLSPMHRERKWGVIWRGSRANKGRELSVGEMMCEGINMPSAMFLFYWCKFRVPPLSEYINVLAKPLIRYGRQCQNQKVPKDTALPLKSLIRENGK